MTEREFVEQFVLRHYTTNHHWDMECILQYAKGVYDLIDKKYPHTDTQKPVCEDCSNGRCWGACNY